MSGVWKRGFLHGRPKAPNRSYEAANRNQLRDGIYRATSLLYAVEPQSGHLHNGTLNDRSRETTRFGEGQLSQERTQFPETSVKKTDGCLQPLAVRRKWHLPADQS